MGGRRRRRSRKMRGGMGYGMSGTIGTAGALYTPSWGGEVTKSGAPVYDTAQRGSSRRRKSKKSKKSHRRRRTMRGGAPWQSVGSVRAEFAGTGERGLGNYVAGAAKVPPAGGPTQNADGAYHA
jgi:hypothetical protein